MKIGISKKILSILGVLVMLLFTSNNTTYASNGPVKEQPQNYVLKFTDSTQTQINLIQNLVTNGGIVVIDGHYSIISDSQEIANLDENTKSKIDEAIDFFNEGISLGLFEINNKNFIVSSRNYEKSKSHTKNGAGIVTPMIAQTSLDSFFQANGNTMLRTMYINTQSYGSNVGMYETGKFFASKVRTGGDWDYKLMYGPNTLYSAYIDGAYEMMTGADIGNAHYGYVGRKVFGANLLRSAAGAYQIYSGTWYVGWYNSYFDDPNDQYWIDRGISYSEGYGF